MKPKWLNSSPKTVRQKNISLVSLRSFGCFPADIVEFLKDSTSGHVVWTEAGAPVCFAVLCWGKPPLYRQVYLLSAAWLLKNALKHLETNVCSRTVA